MDVATRVRAQRPRRSFSGLAIGTATQWHESGSIAPCHEAHLLDVVAGGDGVGCRRRIVVVAWNRPISLTPRHNAVGRRNNPRVQEHLGTRRANPTVMGCM